MVVTPKWIHGLCNNSTSNCTDIKLLDLVSVSISPAVPLKRARNVSTTNLSNVLQKIIIKIWGFSELFKMFLRVYWRVDSKKYFKRRTNFRGNMWNAKDNERIQLSISFTSFVEGKLKPHSPDLWVKRNTRGKITVFDRDGKTLSCKLSSRSLKKPRVSELEFNYMIVDAILCNIHRLFSLHVMKSAKSDKIDKYRWALSLFHEVLLSIMHECQEWCSSSISVNVCSAQRTVSL